MTLVDRYLGAVRDNLPRAGSGRHHQRAGGQPSLPDRRRRGRPWPSADRVRGSGDPQGIRQPDRGRRPISGRRAIGRLRSTTHRPRAVPDLHEGADHQRGHHPRHRSGHPGPRRHDRVDVRRDRGTDPHPVRGRHDHLHGRRPAVRAEPRCMGSAHRRVDRLERRHLDPRWPCRSAHRPVLRQGGPRHDLGPRIRPDHGRPHRVVGHRTAHEHRHSWRLGRAGSTSGRPQPCCSS